MVLLVCTKRAIGSYVDSANTLQGAFCNAHGGMPLHVVDQPTRCVSVSLLGVDGLSTCRGWVSSGGMSSDMKHRKLSCGFQYMFRTGTLEYCATQLLVDSIRF